MTEPQTAPICLVENHNEQLLVNRKAMEILDDISEPVVVVAVVGLYRTGKSYLMNCLAGQNHGFPLGSTVQSETKGIWMWCVPHPTKPKHTLVLLDTEGLGDVEKVGRGYSCFSVSLLPLGNSPKKQASNLPRECIRQFFPNRKCFVFDRPTNDTEFLQKLETVSGDQLNPKFQEQTRAFISYVFTHAKIKTLRAGITVTGNRLGTLVMTYVDAIRSGAVPCLDDAVTILAQRENSAAVHKAAEHYSEQMGRQLKLPTDTLQELLDIHTACEKQALAVFMEHSFKDENQQFQKKLLVICPCSSLSRMGHAIPCRATEVFQSYLKSQAAIESSILQADTALTAGEKAIAEERAQKEAAEKEQELLRQKNKETEQQLEAREKSHKENLEQLRTKLVQEREQLIKDQKMMLEKQLQEQKALLEQGFEKKAQEMNKQIELLKCGIEEMKRNSGSFIDTIIKGAASVLFAPLYLVAEGVKGFISLFK
nr:guanylate-binding protein 6-like [Meriones unguiculatus]